MQSKTVVNMKTIKYNQCSEILLSLPTNMTSFSAQMESQLQVDELNSATCKESLIKQGVSKVVTDSASAEALADPPPKKIRTDVVHQSDMNECLQYEMPLTSLPVPILWNSVDIKAPFSTTDPEDASRITFKFNPSNSILTKFTLSTTACTTTRDILSSRFQMDTRSTTSITSTWIL